MDTTIQIKIMVGPEKGLRKSLTDPIISFGRAGGGAVVLPDPQVSRMHGELRYEHDCWFVVCHSSNGLKVNRRNVAENASRKLNSGDVVSVGSTKLFSVAFTPSVSQPQIETDLAETIKPKRELSRRAKLWIAIGGYLLFVLVVAIILAQVVGDSDSSVVKITQLSDEQIREEIRKPYQRDLDPREAMLHQRQARAWYPRSESTQDGLYRTYNNYKLMLAFLHRTTFEDPSDQLRFNAVERKLVAKIIKDYRKAYALTQNKDWLAADRALRNLSGAYPDSNSAIHKNIQKQLGIVKSNRPKRGFKR